LSASCCSSRNAQNFYRVLPRFVRHVTGRLPRLNCRAITPFTLTAFRWELSVWRHMPFASRGLFWRNAWPSRRCAWFSRLGRKPVEQKLVLDRLRAMLSV